MSELTTGEVRFIQEALNPWKMLMLGITDAIGDVPREVTARLDDTEALFKKEFQAFYEKEKAEDGSKDGDDILGDFVPEWEKLCPAFYDLKEMFAECSEEQLKKAAEPLRRAEEYLG